MVESASTAFYEEILLVEEKYLHGCEGFSLDMGGSLSKLVYIDPKIPVEDCKRTLKMKTFANTDLATTLAFIKDNILVMGNEKKDNFKAVVLGIGSVINHQQITDTLGIEVVHTDEFVGFAKGFHYGLSVLGQDRFIHHPGYSPAKDELITGCAHFDALLKKDAEERKKEPPATTSDLFPSIIVFAGSGIGYQLVHENMDFQIVKGSIRGGLTFYALGKLLTKCKDYEDLMNMAKRGVSSNVSVVLSDLPTMNYAKFDIAGAKKHFKGTVTSFPLGKVITQGITDPNPEDVARVLLYMFSNDIIAGAVEAARTQKIDRIYFAGSFCRDNFMMHQQIQTMLHLYDKWNTGPRLSAGFVAHEGYLGALGTLLCGCEGTSPNMIGTTII